MNFTEIFTDLFLETSLNKTTFANQLGIGHSTIQKYMDGVIPSPKTVALICDYFNCSMDYITGLSDEFNYKNSKGGLDKQCFITEYQKLLEINKTNHYTLSKSYSVNESSLSWWKKGGLPKFEVIFNIAYELGGSIDKLLGRI